MGGVHREERIAHSAVHGTLAERTCPDASIQNTPTSLNQGTALSAGRRPIAAKLALSAGRRVARALEPTVCQMRRTPYARDYPGSSPFNEQLTRPPSSGCSACATRVQRRLLAAPLLESSHHTFWAPRPHAPSTGRHNEVWNRARNLVQAIPPPWPEPAGFPVLCRPASPHSTALVQASRFSILYIGQVSPL